MSDDPLHSLDAYSEFIARTLDRPSVKRSTVRVWSISPFTGIAEGEVWFRNDFRLRIREEIDFDENLIVSYGYEVYRGREKLFWYDDFPHPHDPRLSTTHPHHKHIPPNIKRNRIPAPGLSFEVPNLRIIVREIEQLISRNEEGE
jgi:hypothetical protein